jgi:hypothetical protein
MIYEVWSGGQTGVDQGALVAAQTCGVATSGWMPKGFLTEDGKRPEFAELYGLREMSNAKYPARTRQNAKESDGTLWISGPDDLATDPGYASTSRAAAAFRKPFLVVSFDQSIDEIVGQVLEWVAGLKIARLNVAGPRASKWPEGHAKAQAITMGVLNAR